VNLLLLANKLTTEPEETIKEDEEKLKPMETLSQPEESLGQQPIEDKNRPQKLRSNSL
jgi:hypothetical protein